MAKMQVMTLDNITLYDELIKNYVDTADAKSIKTATLEGKVLKLYRVSEPVGDTAPAYEITLPETDISGLLAKLTGATENNVVIVGADGTVKDSGTALTNLALKTEVEAVDEKIGALADLSTTAKTDLVVAINEVRAAVEVGGTGSQVTIDTSTTTEGYLKTYTFKQGNTEIGKVDIPKDLVVSSGEIVVDPDGQPAGTYLKLTIANQTNPVFVNVKDLVDAYTAQGSATQIQLAISDTNEISATIVAGSVGTTELADNSIITAKIADANVTLAKLGADVTPTLTQVATNKTNIEALQLLVGEGYEPISADAINGLFS